MRQHRFNSMLHIAVRRSTEQRRMCQYYPEAKLKPIRRRHVLRKRAS